LNDELPTIEYVFPETYEKLRSPTEEEIETLDDWDNLEKNFILKVDLESRQINLPKLGKKTSEEM
jgi:hypothetical protein